LLFQGALLFSLSVFLLLNQIAFVLSGDLSF